MSNVVELKKKKEPHGAGEAFCLQCGHEWVAVAPIGVVHLNCPNCGTCKGLYRFPFAPNEGEVERVCNCGNKYFCFTLKGHMCPNCGTYQTY